MENTIIEFITDDKGRKKSAVIPIATYEAMIQQLEDLDDILLYDKSKSIEDDFVRAEEAFKKIDEVRRSNEQV